jgi:hypothetical protein
MPNQIVEICKDLNKACEWLSSPNISVHGLLSRESWTSVAGAVEEVKPMMGTLAVLAFHAHAQAPTSKVLESPRNEVRCRSYYIFSSSTNLTISPTASSKFCCSVRPDDFRGVKL